MIKFNNQYLKGSGVDRIIDVPSEEPVFIDRMGWSELRKLYVSKKFSPFKSQWINAIMYRINMLYKFYYKSGVNKLKGNK